MRNTSITRVAIASAVAVLILGLSACGGDRMVGPGTEPPSTSTPPPPPSNDNGITVPTDLFGPACAQLPGGSPARTATMPASEVIAANPQLHTFTAALGKTGLDNEANGQTATVLAPTDQAFATYQRTLGDQRYNALLNDPAKLATILKDHIVTHRYDRAGLLAASTVTTLQGSLSVVGAGDTIAITDNAGTTAHVLCGNIPTTGATLFIIDQVLQPAKP